MAQISLRMITELLAMDLMNCVHLGRGCRLNRSKTGDAFM